MGKYMFHGSLSQTGLEGLVKNGAAARLKAVQALAKSVGGSMESYHFAFGKDSYYIVCELPSDEAATAVTLAVNASGAATNSTTKLLTAQQVDAALKLSPKYRAPGK
ncbi:MAG: GYD domain-containing protein [Chloroflexota bacterium]